MKARSLPLHDLPFFFRREGERPPALFCLVNAGGTGGTILPDDDPKSYRGSEKMFKDKDGELGMPNVWGHSSSDSPSNFAAAAALSDCR